MFRAGGLGDPIAKGSRSTVYAWGNDAVAKAPLADTPDEWIRAEAVYCDAVHAAGAPVPEFLGFIEHDGRAASVYRRARGDLMWEATLAEPARAAEYGGRLAELQADLAALVPPVVLPAQADRLRAKIRRAARRSGDELNGAAAELRSGGPAVVCHGDLHPGNVILTSDGPVLIDWFDAARGDALADVARTSVLLAVGDPSRHLVAATAELLDAVHAAYLEGVAATIGFDGEAFARWRAVVAVARIAEGLPAEPLLDVWREWRAALVAE